ncbi:MAG: membrane protein of unknown function [Promethearchaeota archaeon]|nr:MAG: membrane protein of unknown function [Candidatus Lokiarchaeota archaeon]
MNEYYFPFLFVVLFIGYQITAYLIYQYYKLKDKSIGYNKIILAYALLVFFGLTGVFLRMIRGYILEIETMAKILWEISHILIVLAALSFLIIVSLKIFDIIIDVRIPRILVIITLIISILLLITELDLIEYILITISIILGGSFFTYFHYKVAKMARGRLKKRIFLIFIGEMIVLSSVILGAEEFIVFYRDFGRFLAEIISIPVILVGLLFLYFGSYNFPVLLEFYWQENILNLFVINKNTERILYSYNFTKNIDRPGILPVGALSDDEIKEVLFSKGIINIEKITSDLMDKEEEVKKIIHGKIKFIISRGENQFSDLIYCLIVSKELKSIDYFLHQIKKKFQNRFNPILNNEDLTFEEKKMIIQSFDNSIIELTN